MRVAIETLTPFAGRDRQRLSLANLHGLRLRGLDRENFAAGDERDISISSAGEKSSSQS